LRTSRSAVLSTLVAGLLWGSSFTVIKFGLRSIDPFWFVFLRFAAASAAALLVTAATGRAEAVGRLLRRPLVLWLGVSNAAGFVLQFNGQTMTSATNAALLIHSSTVLVAVGSRLAFGERFGAAKTTAVVVGMAGVYLVSTGGRSPSLSAPSMVGDLLMLAAAVLWTFFILLDKKIVSGGRVDVQALTAAMVTVTALAALPAAVVFGWGRAPELSLDLWPVAYTAIFCTVLPFFLWTWGLRHITATTSSVIMLAEVVFALALAAVVLGERLSPWAMAGSALILAAVALVTRDRVEEAPAGPDVAPEVARD